MCVCISLGSSVGSGWSNQLPQFAQDRGVSWDAGLSMPKWEKPSQQETEFKLAPFRRKALACVAGKASSLWPDWIWRLKDHYNTVSFHLLVLFLLSFHPVLVLISNLTW